jgi:UDP:flavonoid glycosyltransferase YjiC (YdhE family)
MGLRAILISPNQDGMETAEGNKDILHAKHIPYEKLLGRCALFVHHGGVGTISHAVEAGVPQIVMPRIGDQVDNAHKARRLGVAEVISTKDAATPGGYARAMKAVLGSQTMTRNAKLAQELSRSFTPKQSFVDWVAQQVRHPSLS